jgi:uncharacterized damage-inducible protein DinB
MSDCRPWTAALAALLEQGAVLTTELTPSDFAEASRLSPGGGLGAHLRHVADFVRAFLRDLERGTVDYDLRERDELAERDPTRARSALRRLASEVERLATREPEEPLGVSAEVALTGRCTQASTLARELGFLISHTLHHYALIAMLLRERGLEPPADLGVAPSTLSHWRERNACAPRVG